jgi:hypothetical protein
MLPDGRSIWSGLKKAKAKHQRGGGRTEDFSQERFCRLLAQSGGKLPHSPKRPAAAQSKPCGTVGVMFA